MAVSSVHSVVTGKKGEAVAITEDGVGLLERRMGMSRGIKQWLLSTAFFRAEPGASLFGVLAEWRRRV
jgi:hypothetical protein